MDCGYKEGCYNNREIEEGGYCSDFNILSGVNVTQCDNIDDAQTASSAFDSCRRPDCWETYAGQQLYKLTVTDFLAQFALIFFVDFPRSKLFGGCTGTYVYSVSCFYSIFFIQVFLL